jgi:hypothetical protein
MRRFHYIWTLALHAPYVPGAIYDLADAWMPSVSLLYLQNALRVSDFDVVSTSYSACQPLLWSGTASITRSLVLPRFRRASCYVRSRSSGGLLSVWPFMGAHGEIDWASWWP